jgi:hypothetical protein
MKIKNKKVFVFYYVLLLYYTHWHVVVVVDDDDDDTNNSGDDTNGGWQCKSIISNVVTTNPCTNGIKLQKIIIDTTIAATESATAPFTFGTSTAIAAAINTAVERNVSAHIC